MRICCLAFIGAVLSAPLVGCGGGDDQEIPKSENAPSQDQLKEMEKNMQNMMNKKHK